MHPTTQLYKEAIESGAQQHIRGIMTDLSGTTYSITDKLASDIMTDSQCVESAEEFCIGGMYVGSLQCTLNIEAAVDELTGAEIKLDFGVEIGEDSIEWIPLGVWNITKAKKQSGGLLKITAMDNLQKLLTAESDKSAVRIMTAERIMTRVTDITGVEFAQNLDDLAQLTELPIRSMIGISSGSLWSDIKSIAQILGGFAFANREGKIEFRRLDQRPCGVVIDADYRHNISMENTLFGVKSLSYTTSDGQTYSRGVNTSARGIVGFSGNIFIPDGNGESAYFYYLNEIAPNLLNLLYAPGEVQYYGDPALDVGDHIFIRGGIMDRQGISFLICCNEWHFRGAQTLIASGTSEIGEYSGGSGNSSGSTASMTPQQINITKSVECVELTAIPGRIYEELQTAAYCGISCRSETNCFLECTFTIHAESDCTGQARIYVDGVLQTLQPIFSLDEDKYHTGHFSLNLRLSEGVHSISISLSGSGAAEISAYVSGQNITKSDAEFTDSSDYRYTVESGGTTIDEYIGSGLHPIIPTVLGAKPVKIIGGEAFMESEIESVKIPSGMAEIE